VDWSPPTLALVFFVAPFALAALLAIVTLVLWVHKRSWRARARIAEAQSMHETARAALAENRALEAEKQVAVLEQALEGERRSAREKLSLLEEAEQRMREAFESLSSDALRRSTTSFLEMAKSAFEAQSKQADRSLFERQNAIEKLLQPVSQSLDKVDLQIRQVEKQREGAYREMTAQVRSLAQTHQQLQSETSNLVSALRNPNVRGQWGELQLRRVVEMAGMLDYCDFRTQTTSGTGQGSLRPDLVVRLPGGKQVVVDAKTPLHAYLEAMGASDEDKRRAQLDEHARQVRDHMKALGAKSYWSQFGRTPEFVVMFLPGEAFFGAALDADPALIERGVAEKVIIASPTTLIALLRAVAHGWREEALAENAQRISELGRDLHERLSTMKGHLDKLGRELDRSVNAYNKAMGSFESRVLVTARRFEQLGAASGEISPPQVIEVAPRRLFHEGNDAEDSDA
jgi:DNA recombination protein RmuC